MDEREHAAERTGWGWQGSVADLLTVPPARWQRELEHHHRALMRTSPSQEQRAAWSEELGVLQHALRQVCAVLPHAREWGMVFEFELPMEGGRRPDVVLLAGGSVVVIEFKTTSQVRQSDLDQVAAYAGDLADYHAGTHDRLVVAILVPAGAGALIEERSGVRVTGPDSLASCISSAAAPGRIDLRSWLLSPYRPLPALVEAARRIFNNEPLPHIKQAESVGIPATVALVGDLIHQAAETQSRHLVLITGVPGSGKTLVGLRLVHERSTDAVRSTFLSGNGPLVEVLQDALGSRTFVRGLHAYVRTYGINRRVPDEQIVVFDEAQRAWDREYMKLKRGIARSEPELLIAAAERIHGWSVLVGLVGEGQEIHSGEEAGMPQWRVALDPKATRLNWTIHCPPALESVFQGLPVVTHERLNLTSSLRSRRAADLHTWVAQLLDGRLTDAAALAKRIHHAGFPIYVVRDLQQAKEYAWRRYAKQPSARYGLVASSYAKQLETYGVSNGYQATSRMKVAKWYNEDGSDPLSCCALTQPATEFSCQGLELDLPILCWGEDVQWNGGTWTFNPIRRRYPQEDPVRLLRNTYRVLLTRGRDGLAIFPAEPALR